MKNKFDDEIDINEILLAKRKELSKLYEHPLKSRIKKEAAAILEEEIIKLSRDRHDAKYNTMDYVIKSNEGKKYQKCLKK